MTEPRSRSWMPPIPGPLQQLFDRFPLVTFPANDLPYRSPGPSALPTLYVFVSEEGARKGWPSFNPSCLKWQTFLKLAGVRFRLVPSTNHASPSGALPFLLPPAHTSSSPPSSSPTPISSSSLHTYAVSHGRHPRRHVPAATTPDPRRQTYQSLLDGPLRAAWLHALYLSPGNAPLLDALYLSPATSFGAVRASLRRSLRRAAEAEIARIACGPAGGPAPGAAVVASVLGVSFGVGGGGEAVSAERVYADAGAALAALATLLSGGEAGGTARWFFGAEEPGLFDAAVFAYTQPLLGRGEGALEWGDGRLAELVRRAGDGELVRHRERLWAMLWGSDEREELAG